jgi:hypothetical protein
LVGVVCVGTGIFVIGIDVVGFDSFGKLVGCKFGFSSIGTKVFSVRWVMGAPETGSLDDADGSGAVSGNEEG